MISMLLAAWAAQLFLVVVGLGGLQLLSRGQKIPLLRSLPFAWCFGVLFLYVVGGVLVRTGALGVAWHYGVLGLGSAVIAVAAWSRSRAPAVVSAAPRQATEAGAPTWRWWCEVLIIGFILAKCLVVLYLLLANPVIDSDAANPLRWMGLAKVIGETGCMPDRAGLHPGGDISPGDIHAVGEWWLPSLLAAWTRMFLPRWHDGLVALPWFVTFVAMIAAGFVACWQVTGHRLASLTVAYLFSSVPLMITHVVRPGYSDIVVSCFFVVSMAYVVVVVQSASFDWTAALLACIAAVGCAMTKQEGIIWCAWVLVIVGSFYLRRCRAMRWEVIMSIQVILLACGYLVYRLASPMVAEHIASGSKLRLLFEYRYEPRAIWRFLEGMFDLASFNLLWWAWGISTVCLWRERKAALDAKVMSCYVLALLLGLLYFACFTGNVRYTLIGVNVGRFLLQVAGVALVVCCLFIKHVLFREAEQTDGSGRRADR